MELPGGRGQGTAIAESALAVSPRRAGARPKPPCPLEQRARKGRPAPFVAGRTVSGKITDPGFEHLQWAIDYSKETYTLVEFTQETTPAGGTLLTVTESGFEKIPANRLLEASRMDEEGWIEQLLAAGTKLTRQTVTKHLHVLERVGLVRSAHEGRQTLFELDARPIETMTQYLDLVAGQWETKLKDLKSVLGE